MRMTYLDSGFYEVSSRDAAILCKDLGGFPKHGHQKMVVYDDKKYWLQRTWVINTQGQREQVWAVFEARG